PAFDRDLARARQGELAFGRVLGDGRPGAGVGISADLHRRHQHGARADEGIVADLGAPLVGAVIVHGYRAGADVDLSPDGGVAQVGQVVGLAAGTDLAFLHFHEVADVHVLVQHTVRADPGE